MDKVAQAFDQRKLGSCPDTSIDVITCLFCAHIYIEMCAYMVRYGRNTHGWSHQGPRLVAQDFRSGRTGDLFWSGSKPHPDRQMKAFPLYWERA